MTLRTRITKVAHERGFTAAEVARHLRLYRSNLSAMDAGRRAPSLRVLARIAWFLRCSVGDLIEMAPFDERPVFHRRDLQLRLMERDLGTPDGLEKGWVHTVLLAWQRHYRSVRRKRK